MIIFSPIHFSAPSMTIVQHHSSKILSSISNLFFFFWPR
jgi:hypothetical protein